MRILISFLLLMTSFVIAQENCRVETVYDKNVDVDSFMSIAGSGNTKTSCSDDDQAYCYRIDSREDHGSYLLIKGSHGWLKYGETHMSPFSRQINYKLIEKEICEDKPTLPEPKKCKETYCSGADKKRYESATWYETGTGCSSQNFKMRTIAGGKEISIDYTCENPKKSSGPICIRYYDEPIDCEETNSEDEAPSLPEDIDIPEIDNVPCFGNVEGCNSTNLPDYIDPNTGVPCWGKECNSVKPPDSVGPDGTPCWGDKCGISPPKDKDVNNGGNDNGTGNGDGDGSGSGTGNGNGNGNGEGNGDGESNGWGDCPSGGCPDNSGLINGQGFAKIPDTFHETKYRDKAIEEALDNYIKESPFDFNKIDTDLGVRGSCPVNWSVPFLHGTSINFGVPCSVFDQLRTFFVFLSYLLSFYIVFRKRS